MASWDVASSPIQCWLKRDFFLLNSAKLHLGISKKALCCILPYPAAKRSCFPVTCACNDRSMLSAGCWARTKKMEHAPVLTGRTHVDSWCFCKKTHDCYDRYIPVYTEGAKWSKSLYSISIASTLNGAADWPLMKLWIFSINFRRSWLKHRKMPVD